MIAYAMAHHCTVVTHEIPAPYSRKIKIPDVCRNFNLDYMNTFEMLHNVGARFVLETMP